MTSDEADRCGPPVLVFRSPYFKCARFECRPMDRQPPEKTIAFMYRRAGDGYRQAGVGFFQNGTWKNAKGKTVEGDCLWAAMVDE